LYPSATRLITWFNRGTFTDAEVKLGFTPGFFVFSELTCDDRDTNLFDSRYITTLLPLENEHAPNWSQPSVSADRDQLRPLPDNFYAVLEAQTNINHANFSLLLESYINHIKDRNKLTLLFNDSYKIFATAGESFDEFKEMCISYALTEKSEKALKLAMRYDREIQQLDTGLSHESQLNSGKNSDEKVEQIESLQLACNRFLNKAVSLHVLDVQETDEASIRWTNYGETLRAEAAEIIDSLEVFKEEFTRFSSNLIDDFSELEKETNEKALDIESLNIPLSSCSMRILRVEKVWLPRWNIRYYKSGKLVEYNFRAY
jgi:hypothetical protein